MVEQALLGDIAVALSMALLGGLAAHLVGLPTIPGFLLAGIAIGPFTPGYVANPDVLHVLAEFGVVLLLFGVGLHFRPDQLAAVRGVVLPGALLQVTATTLVGTAGGLALGLEWRPALVLALAVSVASTVVLTRTLEARRLLESPAGRLALGWLIVQDLAMVLVLALIPALATSGHTEDGLGSVALALAKAGVFLAITLIAGARVLPTFLGSVAATRSRELFILAVVSIALAIATVATAFGISVALGAFVAGLALSEAETSRAAAEEVVPLREAFAALFFVSVGMLLDPASLLGNLPLLTLALALVVLNAALAFGALVLAGRRSEAPTVAAGLTQVGEFSFIIASVGVGAGIIDATASNAILGASVISIALNPLAYTLLRVTAPIEEAASAVGV